MGSAADVGESGYLVLYDLSQIATGAALPKLCSYGVSQKRIRCLRSVDPSLIAGMPKHPPVMVTASELGQLNLWTMSPKIEMFQPQQQQQQQRRR